MGWTWQEYKDQPEPFIRTILEKIAAESKVSKET